MSSIWTSAMEEQLARFTGTVGEFARLYGMSEDAARNKLRRLREREQAIEEQPIVSPDEEEFGALEVPKDTFVGFRIGFFDLETTNLSALMGRELCASVADSWGNVTTRTQYDFERRSALDDSGVAEWTRDELERYDILVSWNGVLFDIPFLNARLLRWGKRPIRSDIMGVDAMYKARAGKAGIRIGSAKLDNVAKFFRTPEAKTALEWDTWQLAASGDENAMARVVEHCEADVLVLRSVFQHLKPMIKTIHR